MPSSMLKAPLLLLTLSPTRPHVCWQGCLSGAGVVRAFLLPWYHFIFCLLVFSESAFMRLTDNWETLRGANLTPSLSCIITDALPNEKGGKALMRPPGWNNKARRSVERRGEEGGGGGGEGRGGERVGWLRHSCHSHVEKSTSSLARCTLWQLCTPLCFLCCDLDFSHQHFPCYALWVDPSKWVSSLFASTEWQLIQRVRWHASTELEYHQQNIKLELSFTWRRSSEGVDWHVKCVLTSAAWI